MESCYIYVYLLDMHVTVRHVGISAERSYLFPLSHSQPCKLIEYCYRTVSFFNTYITNKFALLQSEISQHTQSCVTILSSSVNRI